ncbi:hypothetical protein BACT_0004 [Bifidobacterium actinocoloniiforme DSM 22766]|uniref:DUF721 domain-containing protein n=1 Tax=Bifidobacterium actinocoloniiforme DSM 22766 TaxID=1437605 RepID=A0A086Z2P0_9BIFI|nr:DUF721 domain-containing protein [Bifidobacterium actinocoloniiforme]AKV55759.1 hypothetical protein AB656_05785 [Bifidobacterium actinocoloniiforme DSM 22766]KFI40790.1 hypothetical protein BACT_0004 [Bifidobacterium actinocoloniiforme DSM 22766]
MRKPVDQSLGLNPSKLPAQVFRRFVVRSLSRKERLHDAELAWESFGKPGRDPKRLGSVTTSMAGQGGWFPHLKVAQLQDHWDQVVGPAIAAHSTVRSYKEGRLVLQASTPVWATQLTYLIPQLKSTVAARLGMPVTEVVVSGPGSGSGSRGTHAWVRPHRRW